HYLHARSYWAEWVEVAEHGLDGAVQAADPHAEIEVSNHLSVAYRQIGRLEDASSAAERSLALARRWRDRSGEAQALANLAGIHATRLASIDSDQRDVTPARINYEKALALFEETSDQYGQAQVNLG